MSSAIPSAVKKRVIEHVGIRQVKLFTALRGHRADFKISALFIIQDGGKDAGRIEVRQTAPIDGAVDTDQRHGVEVSDDAVIFNRLIRHFDSFLPDQILWHDCWAIGIF